MIQMNVLNGLIEDIEIALYLIEHERGSWAPAKYSNLTKGQLKKELKKLNMIKAQGSE